MHRGDLAELHYIAPIANLDSIRAQGILSHRRASSIEHDSVALQAVQDKRATVVVPRGRPLHEYANLYINARHPMLYKRLPEHSKIVVLRIGPSVIDLPNVVVTDQNAASGWARFAAAPHSSRMCAEVLVPDRVRPGLILGAYVMSNEVAERARSEAPWLDVKVRPKLFFR